MDLAVRLNGVWMIRLEGRMMIHRRNAVYDYRNRLEPAEEP